jgi:hypothetical protein
MPRTTKTAKKTAARKTATKKSSAKSSTPVVIKTDRMSRTALSTLVSKNKNKQMIVHYTKNDGLKRTLFGAYKGMDTQGYMVFTDLVVAAQNNAKDTGRRLVNPKTLSFVKVGSSKACSLK